MKQRLRTKNGGGVAASSQKPESECFCGTLDSLCQEVVAVEADPVRRGQVRRSGTGSSSTTITVNFRLTDPQGWGFEVRSGESILSSAEKGTRHARCQPGRPCFRSLSD